MNTVNTKLKIMAASLLVSAAALIPVQAPVAAVSGTTDIEVQAPNVIILHYYDTLTLTFNDLEEGVNEGTPVIAAQNMAANVTFAAGMTGAGLGDSSFEALGGTMTVTVTDAWAVRALASVGDQIQLTGTLDVADATNGASTITLGALEIIDSDGTVAAAAAGVSFAPPGMSKPGARVGDVRFTLDISGATVSGLHTGAQYTLTATAI